MWPGGNQNLQALPWQLFFQGRLPLNTQIVPCFPYGPTNLKQKTYHLCSRFLSHASMHKEFLPPICILWLKIDLEFSTSNHTPNHTASVHGHLNRICSIVSISFSQMGHRGESGHIFSWKGFPWMSSSYKQFSFRPKMGHRNSKMAQKVLVLTIIRCIWTNLLPSLLSLEILLFLLHRIMIMGYMKMTEFVRFLCSFHFLFYSHGWRYKVSFHFNLTPSVHF